MVLIIFNNDKSVGISIRFSELDIKAPYQSKTIYDKNIQNSSVFVTYIVFDETDSNIRVCLTPIGGELLCFEETTNNLQLNEIEKIILQIKVPQLSPDNFYPFVLDPEPSIDDYTGFYKFSMSNCNPSWLHAFKAVFTFVRLTTL